MEEEGRVEGRRGGRRGGGQSNNTKPRIGRKVEQDMSEGEVRERETEKKRSG